MSRKFIKSNKNANNVTKVAGFTKTQSSDNGLKIEKYASSNTIYSQPHFYSPLHTPQNWQIPSKRNEIYQWARFFFENEPKVGAGIQFYSEFPMQGFELQCSNNKIKKYYERLVKKLKLEYWLPLISAEYFMLGDVFPFVSVNCTVCGGSGVADGKQCNHPGGTLSKLVVLNPDWIEVKQNVLADEPFVQLIPDEDLKRIVMDKFPFEVYNRIPEAFRAMIIAGQPIPLSNRSVTHIKHMPAPYGTYGTSLIRRLFKTLAYKDRLMTANWIVAERLILPIRIVKIGTDDRPAGANDIANVQNQLASVQNDPNLTLVTHHAFDYSYVGAQGSIVQLQAEYDMINGEILDGLMLPQAVLNSEMQGYQGVQIGAEILIVRLENWRKKLAQFIEEEIFLPEAKMQGFINEEDTRNAKEKVYLYPSIKWNDLNIRDDTQKKQQMIGLHDSGIISTQTLAEIFDFDYDQEIERRREEANIQMSLGGNPMGPGGAPMGGPPGLDMGGMPPPPPPGGMDMGAPDMGGDMGGDMGAGPMASSSAQPEKIMKRKNKKKVESQSEKKEDQATSFTPGQIQLTSIEKILWNKLFNDPAYYIPFQKRAQYKIQNPNGNPYVVDFAIPQLKIAIEADGRVFHSAPEKVAKDQERDQTLSRKGWIVLRFDEEEIEEQIENVMGTVMKYIGMKQNAMANPKKRKASNILKNINKTINRFKEE